MFLNARYHDPRLGIFLSVDPLITTTNEPYLYASGNPTTLSDPTGLMALPGGEWLCEGGGVQGCGSHAVKDRVYNAKKNLWDDLHGRARTPGVIGSGCHIGTDSQGRCKQMSGLRPISTLTDLFFDPDACRGFSWSCVIEIAGIIPYGKILKVGKLSTTLTKTTDRLSDAADTAHDINKATNTVRSTSIVDDVIAETQSGARNLTSRYTLTADEALTAGERWVGSGYTEIGKPGSGVFRSADGTRQFRIDNGSITGAHSPGVPHVHLETIAPGPKVPVVNNHIPIAG